MNEWLRKDQNGPQQPILCMNSFMLLEGQNNSPPNFDEVLWVVEPPQNQLHTFFIPNYSIGMKKQKRVEKRKSLCETKKQHRR